VIHRVRVKDPIQGHPCLHPKLSHSSSPSPVLGTLSAYLLQAKIHYHQAREKNFFYLAGSSREEWSDLRATPDLVTREE
jgi:hypothetical protein